MKTEMINTKLGDIIIEEKDSAEDKEVFVGAIRMRFKPNLPKQEGKHLKIFSCSMPEHSEDKSYRYLMSWYNDNGRNVNTKWDGD